MHGERPATSKSRGICLYYNTPRGCYAGDKCKFLHGEAERLTPYDKNKPCHYYAKGYCRHGVDCWFKHVDPNPPNATASTSTSQPAEEAEELVCCICYEKLVTFGLLEGCSHVFCVGCIREWRASYGKSEEVVASGVTKQCPLCRAPSKFITPSSKFFPQGDPRKTALIEQYKASMARVLCRHFEKSPPNDRFCPFGKDCFFQHRNSDGSPYVFTHGVDHNMKVYRRRQERERFANLRRFTDSALLGYDSDDDILSDIPEERDDESGDGNSVTGSDLDGNLDTLAPFIIDNDIRMEDMVARLAILLDTRVGLVPDFVDAHDRAVSPIGTDETLVNTTGAEPTAAQSTAVSRGQSPLPILEPRAATPPIPAPDPAVQRPSVRPTRAASEPLPRSRFSTVVDRRPRSISDHLDATLDDARPLPDSASSAVIPASADSPSTQGDRVQNDEQVSREAEALLDEAPDFDRRVEDVMRSLEASDIPASPLAAVVEPPREEARSPCADAATEAMQDVEPPFLTDGRGRVVWSNTAAGRHRDGRRVRASTAPAQVQQKGRRDVPDTETASMRNAEDSADESVARQSSRPRAPRAQTSGAAIEGGTWVPVEP
ncbi:uncharacterized protein C8Q71DRAFT_744529 [Rhodofomes roseus]|uniref:RING-type E3 ubiquitin transferase n=1 Tax=Rhodofomes roseus TaxID=34475 RepID=A0ABQ8KPH2_9APHY|nr:uncharacterized protein C8Q71DRAFT_744529 [Rhodofomes roseus]KAH9839855.1 hypothetical protein C8Q71DRAFT_744529 [Rhodofomes roseus]